MKNVVFDIGKFVVRWSPAAIVEATSGQLAHTDQWITNIFQHDLWTALNLGKISERQAKRQYTAMLAQEPAMIATLSQLIKQTQVFVIVTNPFLRV